MVFYFIIITTGIDDQLSLRRGKQFLIHKYYDYSVIMNSVIIKIFYMKNYSKYN